MKTVNAPAYTPRPYLPKLICLECNEFFRGRKELAEHIKQHKERVS